MNRVQHIIAERNDDYLDLLNYAIQIGDLEWQQEIIASLSHWNSSDDWAVTESLWREYDEITHKLMKVYETIRQSTDEQSKKQLLQQWWELKMQRIHVSRQIQSETAGHDEQQQQSCN